jgi:HIV-1 Vpr-binding protein
VIYSTTLWDVRSGGFIHKFDKFTDHGSGMYSNDKFANVYIQLQGIFSPGGNEVIINSEIWDLRTFKLLKTVPGLDQTVIKFNSAGDIIYAGNNTQLNLKLNEIQCSCERL